MAAPSAATQNEAQTMIGQLISSQNNFFGVKGGRYFQGLPTHSVPPIDALAVPDRLTAKPTDQPENWNGFRAMASTRSAITLNIYDGPRGKGWEIMFTTRTAGGAETWSRVVNVGPEPYRDRSWSLNPPPR